MRMRATLFFLTSLFHHAFHVNAVIKTARYGACTGTDENGPYHHCHFDSNDCNPGETTGETWINPIETEAAGYKCTCDDNYNKNVLMAACYSTTDHQVRCVADSSQCPAHLMAIGDRYSGKDSISDDCGHGDAYFGASMDPNAVKPSCGKQCRCSYRYVQGSDTVDAGTTNYGVCYDAGTEEEYCAVKADNCLDNEEFQGPHGDELNNDYKDPKCTCANTMTGACINSNDEFSHCAVAADSCASGQSFLKIKELEASNVNVDCYLCNHVPDQCHNILNFRLGGKKKNNCKWIGAKANRRKKNCKMLWIRKQCPSTCGVCCADTPGAFFKVNKKKKGCKYLNPKFPNRIAKNCPKATVRAFCPVACNACHDSSELDSGSDDD